MRAAANKDIVEPYKTTYGLNYRPTQKKIVGLVAGKYKKSSGWFLDVGATD